MHLVDTDNIRQFLYDFFQSCNVIPTRSKNLSHSLCKFGTPMRCQESFIVMSYAPEITSCSCQSRTLHVHQLQFGLSLNYIELGEVCSNTTCNSPKEFKYYLLNLKTNISFFNVFCTHSHTLFRVLF